MRPKRSVTYFFFLAVFFFAAFFTAFLAVFLTAFFTAFFALFFAAMMYSFIMWLGNYHVSGTKRPIWHYSQKEKTAYGCLLLLLAWKRQ